MKATNGDTFLGGEDFDNALLNYMVQQFKSDQVGKQGSLSYAMPFGVHLFVHQCCACSSMPLQKRCSFAEMEQLSMVLVLHQHLYCTLLMVDHWGQACLIPALSSAGTGSLSCDRLC